MSHPQTRRRTSITADPAVRIARAQIAQIFAMIGTVLVVASLIFRSIGAYQTQKVIGELNEAGLGDMKDVSSVVDAISDVTAKLPEATIPSDVGLITFVLGGAMLIYALHRGRYRQRWFFWSTLGLGLVLLAYPIVGSVLGFLLLWYLLWTRHEFFALPIVPTAE
jgi:hypothetical protein